MAQATVSAQARIRAGSLWTQPAPPTLMHTRPLRSSPLAGPAFSSLPTIISESSEESHGEPLGESSRELGHTRSQSSSSVVSQAASGSGYGTGYGSGHGSMLVEGEGSTSSISLPTSANGTASSQGHGNSSSPKGPARLSKSSGGKGFFGRGASSSESPVTETSLSPSLAAPPRARTTSGHSRSASLPTQYVLSPPQNSAIPQVYSRTTSRPTSPESSTTHLSAKSNHTEAQNAKQPPSKSRDPTSNWMSSSPFGPATTPKFSRLALASPAVVMPLSAKEYRKRKAKESHEKGKKEKELPTPPNHVTFTDTPISRPSPSQAQSASSSSRVPGTPSVSAPAQHVSSSSSDSNQLRAGRDPDPDSRSIPLPHARPVTPPAPAVIHPLSLQPSKRPVQPRPSSPKKPRSRPNTPPRFPPTPEPLITPKSSTNTFFSFNSSSDDEIAFPPKDQRAAISDPPSSAPPNGASDLNGLPPARPRPRPRRRKSFPERLSNGGTRLSLLEAVNRLSQEGSLIQLSAISPKNSANRLSALSQSSGNTLFYDFSESEREEPEREHQQQEPVGNGDAQNPRVSVTHTQSLEDLSSTLARTGIEVVERDLEDDTDVPEDAQKGKRKRNVRMVRISDTVEVSPPPAPRRRKLTKSRPGSTPVKEPKAQNHERRTSLLPWRSKGSGEGKAVAVVGVVDAEEKSVEAHDGRVLTPTKGLGPSNVTDTPNSVSPAVENAPPPPESRNGTPTRGTLSGASTPTPNQEPPSASPRRGRRYTFQFISAPSFHLPKREKSKTEPTPIYMNSDTSKKGKKKGRKGVESGFGTDSTGTSTVTQGSQSTLTPISPASTHSSAFIDLTVVTPPRPAARKHDHIVPDFQTLVAQERAKALGGITSSQSRGDSTPSLTTSGSTATSSSSPGSVPSVARLHGGSFIPRPSTLKESFTDTSEDDSEGMGRARVYGNYHSHHRREQRTLLTATETSEDDEKQCRHTSPRPSSRPGTGSSTLTTATTASYVSFSTVPASTSSPSSSSASLSPSMTEEPTPVEKRNGIFHGPVHADVHHCVHCGHPIAQSPSPTNAKKSDPSAVPMFTVPLVTVPPPVVSRTTPAPATLPRSGSTTPTQRSHSPTTIRTINTGAGKSPSQTLTQSGVTIVSTPAAAWQQQTSTRKNDKHMSVPAPAPAPSLSPSPAHTKLNPSTPPRAVLTKGRPSNVAKANHGPANPGPAYPAPPELTIAINSAATTQAKRRRPQTAPAGSGDVAFKFMEAARLQETRGEGVAKSGGGESKLKSLLKGWLKRS